MPGRACFPRRTARSNVIDLVTREKYTSFGLGRINFLFIAKNSLREMGRGQVFTVGHVDEVGKRKEDDEEKPEA